MKLAAGISTFSLSLLLLAAFPAADKNTRVRLFDFTYTADLPLPSGAQRVDLWLPYPQSDGNQTITQLKIDAPVPTRVTRDREYGNSILYTRVDRPKAAQLRIEMQFRVERRENVRRPSGKENGHVARDPLLARWLEPDRLVPINGTIRDLALEVTQGKTAPLEKARAIYDYAVSTLKYDKS